MVQRWWPHEMHGTGHGHARTDVRVWERGHLQGGECPRGPRVVPDSSGVTENASRVSLSISGKRTRRRAAATWGGDVRTDGLCMPSQTHRRNACVSTGGDGAPGKQVLMAGKLRRPFAPGRSRVCKSGPHSSRGHTERPVPEGGTRRCIRENCAPKRRSSPVPCPCLAGHRPSKFLLTGLCGQSSLPPKPTPVSCTSPSHLRHFLGPGDVSQGCVTCHLSPC